MGNKFECDIPNYTERLPIFEESLRTELGWSIEGEAKRTAPVDSGVYRNNIEFNGKNQVIAHASYSATIEYGITPNDRKIFPVNKKALHFKINGKDVFAKWAKPFKKKREPRPVMRNAVRTVMKRDFQYIYKKYWKSIMEKK